MPGHRPIFAQHENVIADDLEVVRREVARHSALVVTVRHLAVRFHAEMAAETARHPRRVTRITSDAAFLVSKPFVRRCRVSPGGCVALHRLCVSRLLVVIRVTGR